MKHFRLSSIPEEWVTDKFSRRFFSGKNITFAFLTLKEGCVIPEHSHESEQFSYIATGELQFVIGGTEVAVKAGEMVEIPAWVPHSATAVADSTGIDCFSPVRRDWEDGSDNYLRRG